MQRLILVFVFAISACARSPAPRASTRIEGDLFLTFQNGDTKRGAGRTVYLLADTDSLRADLKTACDLFESSGDAAVVVHDRLLDDSIASTSVFSAKSESMRSRESALYGKAFDARKRVVAAISMALARAVRDSAPTGMNAHYAFANAPRGKYALYAEWPIGKENYRWLASVDATIADTVRRDLDNTREVGRTFYCGTSFSRPQ